MPGRKPHSRIIGLLSVLVLVYTLMPAARVHARGRIRNFRNDPNLAEALKRDSGWLPGKSTPDHETAEWYYLAYVAKEKEAWQRARVYAHLGALYAVGFDPSLDHGNRAKARMYFEKALQEEPNRIGWATLQARTMLASLRSEDNVARLQADMEVYAFLRGLDAETLRARWLPTVPETLENGPSDQQVQDMTRVIEDLQCTTAYNLASLAASRSTPDREHWLQVIIERFPGTEAAERAQKALAKLEAEAAEGAGSKVRAAKSAKAGPKAQADAAGVEHRAGGSADQAGNAWSGITSGAAQVRLTIKGMSRGHPDSMMMAESDPRRKEIWRAQSVLQGRACWRTDPNRLVFELDIQHVDKTAQPAEFDAWLKWLPFTAQITVWQDPTRMPSIVIEGQGLEDALGSGSIYAGRVAHTVGELFTEILCPVLCGRDESAEDGKGIAVTVDYPEKIEMKVGQSPRWPMELGRARPMRFWKTPVICDGDRVGWRLETMSLQRSGAEYHSRLIDGRTGLVTHAVTIDMLLEHREQDLRKVADLLGVWQPDDSAPYRQYQVIEIELEP